MDTLLIVGLVIGAGWCFFMGPCKGMLDGLGGGGGGSEFGGPQRKMTDSLGNFVPVNATPELESAVEQIQTALGQGKISEAQARKQAAVLADKYKANYGRSYQMQY